MILSASHIGYVPEDDHKRCPKCGAQITWSCGSSGEGYAQCINNIKSTRVFDLDTVYTQAFCDWHGFCERRPDGKVEIYYYGPI